MKVLQQNNLAFRSGAWRLGGRKRGCRWVISHRGFMWDDSVELLTGQVARLQVYPQRRPGVRLQHQHFFQSSPDNLSVHQVDKPWERQTKEAEVLILPKEVVSCGKMVSTGTWACIHSLFNRPTHTSLLWFWAARAHVGYTMVPCVGLATKCGLIILTLASWLMRHLHVSWHMSQLNDFLIRF